MKNGWFLSNKPVFSLIQTYPIYTQNVNGGFKFVIGEGISKAGPIPPTGNTNTRGFFEPTTKEFIKKELDSNELYEIKVKPEIPSRDLGIITLKNNTLSYAASKFIEIILKGKE